MLRNEKNLLASFSLLIVQQSTALAADNLIFYGGNNCTRDIVFTYDSNRYDIDDNCKSSGSGCYGENDEARSLKLLGSVNSGVRVEVYDSPDGDTGDDYAFVEVLDPSFDEFCVGTFEERLLESGVFVYVGYNNGLDGKISHVTVIPNEFPRLYR